MSTRGRRPFSWLNPAPETAEPTESFETPLTKLPVQIQHINEKYKDNSDALEILHAAYYHRQEDALYYHHKVEKSVNYFKEFMEDHKKENIILFYEETGVADKSKKQVCVFNSAKTSWEEMRIVTLEKGEELNIHILSNKGSKLLSALNNLGVLPKPTEAQWRKLAKGLFKARYLHNGRQAQRSREEVLKRLKQSLAVNAYSNQGYLDKILEGHRDKWRILKEAMDRVVFILDVKNGIPFLDRYKIVISGRYKFVFLVSEKKLKFIQFQPDIEIGGFHPHLDHANELCAGEYIPQFESLVFDSEKMLDLDDLEHLIRVCMNTYNPKSEYRSIVECSNVVFQDVKSQKFCNARTVGDYAEEMGYYENDEEEDEDEDEDDYEHHEESE